jgi:nucleotidyltransferase/DNA polymerase involved in DNA repair
MDFEIVGGIAGIELIAEGHGIRDRSRLCRSYGAGNWKKKKGTATVRYANGVTAIVELHWYEAHGIGRREKKKLRALFEYCYESICCMP